MCALTCTTEILTKMLTTDTIFDIKFEIDK